MSAGNGGRSQRSSSICLSNQMSFDAMKNSVGNRESSGESGSDSPDVRRAVNEAVAQAVPLLASRPVKARQKAGRSKSERLQGANKPRVKRRDVNQLDMNRTNSGSIVGEEQQQQAFLRKVPSVGTSLMNESFNDTPEGSPRLTGRPVRPASGRPPLGSSNVPALSTPELSPSLIRRATVNSAGARVAASNNNGRVPVNRSSPVSRAKDQPLNKRATSVRVHGASSSLVGLNSTSSIRRSTFLDVPDSPTEDDGNTGNANEDSYRLRSFDLTRKGVVNRGDSFRRRRSRSNSLAPSAQDSADASASGTGIKSGISRTATGGTPTASSADVSNVSSTDRRPTGVLSHSQHSVHTYRVAIIGAHGVGKSAMVGQFMTSDCINAYDRVRSEDADSESVFVMLNGEESELVFSYVTNIKAEMNRTELPDAYVIMYSVIDKSSFQRAEDELARLQNWDAIRTRTLIVVGNKIDLVRSRAVSTQDGKCLACAYRAKFMEVAVVINHNVDELLVGILTQIRLKEELQRDIASGLVVVPADGSSGQASSTNSWIRNKGLVRASMKAKQMFTWLFGKDDDQFANCENFQVL